MGELRRISGEGGEHPDVADIFTVTEAEDTDRDTGI